MKKFFVFLVILTLVLASIYVYSRDKNSVSNGLHNPLKSEEMTEIKNGETKIVDSKKNTGYLAKYNFINLRERKYVASEIKKIGRATIVDDARKELVKRGDLVDKNFDFETWAISFSSNGKNISGMMNLPVGYENKKSPAIIMIRGFAESSDYFIGSGSWRAADELARNGYVTVSLDFLGFGLSDGESKDILEARFEKPIGVLDLIESVKNLDFVDKDKIGIWAHSNGGQIAISVLEITGKYYPTVLWAPMTNPFPQSILETINDESEASLIVRRKIEDFEKEYDSRLYSIDTFYDLIMAPIIIHQGTEDVWCKVDWQVTFKNKLNLLGKEVILEIEEGNDHNLKQSWDRVMERDLKFFESKFKKI